MTYVPREDSYFIADHIPNGNLGRVLDMGTGSGILARTAKPHADSVTVVDTDPKALEKFSASFNTIRSDLFENVDETYDTIIFNPPYLPEGELNDATIEGGEHGYEVIIRFISQAPSYLAREGTIMFLISSHTGIDTVQTALHKNDLEFECVASKDLFFETLYVYKAWHGEKSQPGNEGSSNDKDK